MTEDNVISGDFKKVANPHVKKDCFGFRGHLYELTCFDDADGSFGNMILTGIGSLPEDQRTLDISAMLMSEKLWKETPSEQLKRLGYERRGRVFPVTDHKAIKTAGSLWDAVCQIIQFRYETGEAAEPNKVVPLAPKTREVA